MPRFLMALCVVLPGGQGAMGQIAEPSPKEAGVYQLSGVALESEEGLPIAFVSIHVKGTRRGTFTNDAGFFSLPVTKGDTLVIQRLGYHTREVPVSGILARYGGGETYVYKTFILEVKSHEIEEVDIYPYQGYAEVKTALVNMPTPGQQPIEMARNNLQPNTMGLLARNMPKNAADRLSLSQRQYLAYMAQRNSLNTVGIDPTSVVKLIQYMGKKSEQERERILNYWPTD